MPLVTVAVPLDIDTDHVEVPVPLKFTDFAALELNLFELLVKVHEPEEPPTVNSNEPEPRLVIELLSLEKVEVTLER